jgi:hypothetical protein
MTTPALTPLGSKLPFPGGNGDGQPWTGLLEVLQAHTRWQNAYSPAQAAAQEFFGRPARGLCSLHRDYPRHQHYLLQQALPACLSGWERTVAVSFRSQEPGELPLSHVVVPSGPGTWDAALDDARVGYVGPAGARVMARLALTHEEGVEVACFTLIGTAEQAGFLRTLLVSCPRDSPHNSGPRPCPEDTAPAGEPVPGTEGRPGGGPTRGKGEPASTRR